MKKNSGYIILEAMLAVVVLSMVVLSVVPMLSYLLRRTARSQLEPQAALLMQEGIEVAYNIFTSDWDLYPVDGIYHPGKSTGRKWVLITGAENNLQGKFTRKIEVSRACRSASGELTEVQGLDCVGQKDSNTRIIQATIEWQEEGQPKTLTGKILLSEL